MKAITYYRYGTPDEMRVEEIERPVPGDDEVLVKVAAASVNAYDWHFLTADVFLLRISGGGFLKPKYRQLGADLAGRVEAVGRNVTTFRAGDKVFGEGKGSFAEYAIAAESSVARKLPGQSFEEAAAVPMAAMTALQGLRDVGRIQAGKRVLINGAAGGVGTFAVQIARAFGAEVTAVCSSRNLEQARSLGADHVIDYTLEDFTRSGKEYDLIFGANGYHSLSEYKRALAPRGIYVMAGGSQGQIFEALFLGWWKSLTGGRTMRHLVARRSQKDLLILNEMMESGKVVPVIDRRYPLGEAAEALRYLGQGHARGKVVITI